jgi:(E)-4-hydroxy-3-methyl-but-2-enyl pyrophosphate reductase
MKIIKADKAGFCFGVERAVSIAREALAQSREPVYSLGPIIHNPQVVGELAEAGLRVVESLGEVKSGIIIIRSHGAPTSIYEMADRKGLTVLDATCPFVKNMHQLARNLARDGYQVVLFGDRQHPEITSLLDDPDSQPLVVNSAEEARGAKLGKKVGLLSQTTQSPELFNAVAQELLPAVKELRIYNTICDSTRQRQEEALEISKKVEVMIVIGGRNSANTRRLYDLCRSTGTPAHLVEVPEEVSREWLDGARAVGVTAGASTPRRLIDRVVEKINSLNNEPG